MWDLWLPSVLWGWPLLVPQPLSLKGLLLPSACWPIPLRCHSLHLVTSTWFLCCKALTGKGDLNCHGRAGVRADPHHGLPGPMAADEHIQSKAHNLRLPVAPPKLSLRQPVHNGTFFHSTLCTHDCSPPHLQNVTTVTCVECGFVSHFIGGKIGIATFFILNRAFWKQVAIEHTPTLSPGVGTVGFM